MSNQIYYVSKKGSLQGQGTENAPFLTINQAASVAVAGDKVIVHQGEYREWVKPKNKGESNNNRIIYQAAENEKVVIKGSEIIKNWELVEGTVWKATIDNELFGEFNPFFEEVNGDWIIYEDSRRKHLGDVYLNGMSFYEADMYEELINPSPAETVLDVWSQEEVPVKNVEQTKYRWFVEVNEQTTIIYANFHESDPNKELVEINVRKSCFYPERTGRDYITVKGFEMAQAATPWTPPTSEQIGIIGANWSKGWIIEDNIIYDAKNSAISIGKERNTGHNDHTIKHDKPSYQYQLESVFSARQIGWSKERVGSHIVRNNIIYDCGQNGIVGHLGCIFSEIYGNHIYNIGLKREYFGHEIAGIKLHGAIDVQIHDNRIHDSTIGLWLDWQTQGTRVSRNVHYRNNRDLFVEVSHGPYVIDHNIFVSAADFDNYAQGGAYINNLICGNLKEQSVMDRATPYHQNHSTEVAGFAVVYEGDDHYYGNMFVGDNEYEPNTGTAIFNDYPTSMDEYIEEVFRIGPGNIYLGANQPVYIDQNAYFNGAEAFDREKNKLEMNKFDPEIEIIEENEEVYLSIVLPDEIEEHLVDLQGTSTLNAPRIVALEYEETDGSDLVIDSDFFGKKKKKKEIFGPISTLTKGENRVKIW